MLSLLQVKPNCKTVPNGKITPAAKHKANGLSKKSSPEEKERGKHKDREKEERSEKEEKKEEETSEESRAEEQAFLVELYKYMKERDTPIERIPFLGFKQSEWYTTSLTGNVETVECPGLNGFMVTFV